MTHPDREVLQIAASNGVITGQVRIPVESPFFDGHFPGGPLLPGVAQLRLVADLAAEGCGVPIRVIRVVRVKFSSPIRPGAVLTFRIEAAPGSTRLAWRLNDARAEVSTGEMAILQGTR